ncbi:MAG: RNA polymerase subunit sigma-28 [Deltaproteobacteria bacterium]|nr:MAG: RNA polymerase subunit sigma-28 [Deltaproteobacteria bacterium]
MIDTYVKAQNSTVSNVQDPAAREAQILQYAYLVRQIASRMAARIPPSVSLDELISAGSLGLIDAVDKFNPAKAVDFKTYAQYRIKGAILDELRSMDWYSRSMRKRMQDIEKAVHQVEGRLNRPATEQEIADALKLSMAEYHKLLGDIHNAALLSMDAAIRNEENGETGIRTFQAQMKSADKPEENVLFNELRDELAAAIRRLNEKEQLVISLYYYEDLTLKQIGEVLGLTESRICQIHTMAIVRMKTRMRKYNERLR